jgi:hypothetical protein
MMMMTTVDDYVSMTADEFSMTFNNNFSLTVDDDDGEFLMTVNDDDYDNFLMTIRYH